MQNPEWQNRFGIRCASCSGGPKAYNILDQGYTDHEYDDQLNPENPQIDVGVGSSALYEEDLQMPKRVTFPELAAHRGVAQWNNSVFDDRWGHFGCGLSTTRYSLGPPPFIREPSTK